MRAGGEGKQAGVQGAPETEDAAQECRAFQDLAPRRRALLQWASWEQ